MGRERLLKPEFTTKKQRGATKKVRRGTGQVSTLDAETIKHATVNKNEIGVKRIFSPVLNETMLPSVLSPSNAVMVQDKTLMVVEIGKSPMSPARRRMT